MPAIDQPGLYRGPILDHALGCTSKAELPQFVATFRAMEVYNDATETWDDWNYGQTIIGYFVLATLNDQGIPIKCFPRDDVMEAIDWDGLTYAGLAAMDVKGRIVQFRVGEDTYDGNTKMKVMKIAAENADIGLRKLSKNEVADLDAKFGIASTSAKPKTAATPKKKAASKSQALKSAAPKPPKATPPKIEKSAEATDTESCTELEAFEACDKANDALTKSVPEQVLKDYWVQNVFDIAADDQNVTDEEWVKVRNATLKDIDIPF